MITNAESSKDIRDVSVRDVSVQLHKTRLLSWENEKIVPILFDTIVQRVTHWDKNKNEYSEDIDFSEISNAAIFYAISQKKGKVIGCDDFNNDKAQNVICKYISPDIQNAPEVAREIYYSWNTLAQKREFICNVTSGRVRVDSSEVVRGLQPLTPIPNFSGFMNGLINACLSTVANGKEIQAWSLMQSIELFLSAFQGRPFDTDKAKQLLLLDECLENCKDGKPSEEKKLLENLQRQIECEQGMWLTVLKEFVGQEITNLIKIFRQEQVRNALNMLLQDNYEKVDNIQFKKELQSVISCLQADTTSDYFTYVTGADRADGRQLPSISLFKEGVKHAILKAARDNEIALGSYSIFNKQMVGKLFPGKNLHIFIQINDILDKFVFTRDSNFFEVSLLRFFGFNVEMKRSKIEIGDRISAVPEIDFLLDIDASTANDLVRAINKKCHEVARVIQNTVQLPSTGASYLSRIAIDREIFSNSILPEIKEYLTSLRAYDLDFFEKFQLASRVRKSPRRQQAENLAQIANRYQEKNQSFANHLTSLAKAIESGDLDGIKKSSFEVRKKINQHELSLVDLEALTSFKEGDKKRVKEIQRDIEKYDGIPLGYYKK
jgi:uncharacterized membrane protein YheB (UPF0754 family)